MSYAGHLRKLFTGISLIPEDLLLLESFQIKQLPDRLPKKEFAALLRANPVVHQFFIVKYPPIKEYIDMLLGEIGMVQDPDMIETYSQEALWEVAELIVYNKYPEVYDETVKFNWELSEIIPPNELKGKTVLDVGAGTGQLAFFLAPHVKNIFAVEPLPAMRQYIREKARKEKTKNLFVMDGFLDSLPFPDNSVDILMTSNAIGWNIEGELSEIERVVKKHGAAIHLMRTIGNKDKSPVHNILVSPKYGYSFTSLEHNDGVKFRYVKSIF